MLKSMTGFGRATGTLDGLEATVEIKSVNHRFFEFSGRLPRSCQFAEEPLKEMCRQSISRGKIELGVFIEDHSEKSVTVEINRPYAEAYISALKRLAREYRIKDDVKVSVLAGNSDILTVKRTAIREDTVLKLLKEVTQRAIDGFLAMRAAEGERLCADIGSRADKLLEDVALVEERSPETVRRYRERLERKLRELLLDVKADEQRLITETAIFADKIAVDEETVRLRSHIAQLKKMLDGDGPMGKRLDFTVQEMNREANTIGSKCQDSDIAYTVVDMKSEIEKIREQVQNIE